jgi:hypothetical protein
MKSTITTIFITTTLLITSCSSDKETNEHGHEHNTENAHEEENHGHEHGEETHNEQEEFTIGSDSIEIKNVESEDSHDHGHDHSNHTH